LVVHGEPREGRILSSPSYAARRRDNAVAPQ
jgi:hypothetical protein